mmetsp:Transcript_9315/g.23164  ORF Transcript_9315/g.23164 Transcript_9315/m.23164 type:complete len:217 (+) Transcript_9315:562-1212(+)
MQHFVCQTTIIVVFQQQGFRIYTRSERRREKAHIRFHLSVDGYVDVTLIGMKKTYTVGCNTVKVNMARSPFTTATFGSRAPLLVLWSRYPYLATPVDTTKIYQGQKVSCQVVDFSWLWSCRLNMDMTVVRFYAHCLSLSLVLIRGLLNVNRRVSDYVEGADVTDGSRVVVVKQRLVVVHYGNGCSVFNVFIRADHDFHCLCMNAFCSDPINGRPRY